MIYKNLIPFVALLLISSHLNAEYTLKISDRKRSKIDRMPKARVADMKNIPQNPEYYAKQIKPFSKSEQSDIDEEFNEKYFKPWALRHLDLPSEDFGWEMRFVTKKPIYSLNKKEILPFTYNRWISNAQMSQLDTKKYKAITVRRTNVKALPTSRAFYRDPRKVGEGFPFDYNQNSALHINVPLYISHFSKDNRWAYVRASYSFGWVKVRDLALVNTQFIKKFKSGKYAITTKDNLRLFNEKMRPVSLVKLGALFPLSKSKTDKHLVAVRDSKGHAHMKEVKILGKGLAAKKPLPFTSRNVALLAKEFYGEPYGWGGGYECRDCSATTRDFLAPFGIFLRRNSSKQAKDGESINIFNLSKEEKKKTIISKAKPFRSLLYVPGHIVLYLGTFKGEPVVMHTYWGIRKKDGTKLITGRTIITSTEPGKERNDVKESAKLIHTLKAIVNFD